MRGQRAIPHAISFEAGPMLPDPVPLSISLVEQLRA